MRNAGITALLIGFLVVSRAGGDDPTLPMPTMGTASPSVIQSQVIPPTIEPLIVFTHKGEVLAVGQRTGKVIILGQGGTIIPPDPVKPVTPAVTLTGLPKKIYDSFIASVQQSRVEAARAVIQAIDNTTNQAGGLGVSGQSLVNLFGQQMRETGAAGLVSGWALGDLLQAEGVDTDDKFLAALADVKRAMGAVK